MIWVDGWVVGWMIWVVGWVMDGWGMDGWEPYASRFS